MPHALKACLPALFPSSATHPHCSSALQAVTSPFSPSSSMAVSSKVTNIFPNIWQCSKDLLGIWTIWAKPAHCEKSISQSCKGGMSDEMPGSSKTIPQEQAEWTSPSHPLSVLTPWIKSCLHTGLRRWFVSTGNFLKLSFKYVWLNSSLPCLMDPPSVALLLFGPRSLLLSCSWFTGGISEVYIHPVLQAWGNYQHMAQALTCVPAVVLLKWSEQMQKTQASFLGPSIIFHAALGTHLTQIFIYWWDVEQYGPEVLWRHYQRVFLQKYSSGLKPCFWVRYVFLKDVCWKKKKKREGTFYLRAHFSAKP